MPDLEIRLLGPPEVRSDGIAIDVPRRRVRALLFYLAAHDAPRSRGDPLALL